MLLGEEVLAGVLDDGVVRELFYHLHLGNSRSGNFDAASQLVISDVKVDVVPERDLLVGVVVEVVPRWREIVGDWLVYNAIAVP